MQLVHTLVSTPSLGSVIIAAEQAALAGVWFVGQDHAPDTRSWLRDDAHPLLRRASDQVLAYLRGDLDRFDLPLRTEAGTEFQRQVWQQVQRIQRGQVCSYADIAAAVGSPKAARAVGQALGRNPWLMLVPCHRVMGSRGKMTGYAAGIERKKYLLRLEGALH